MYKGSKAVKAKTMKEHLSLILSLKLKNSGKEKGGYVRL